ncbi:MAG TPA: L,D-transpeptidase family protein [Pyrinomonadaceae bacterium]
MLLPVEHTGVLRRWPATSSAVRAVAIRLVIGFVLLLLIGALSCTVALARKTNKPRQRQLEVQERLEAEQRLWDLGYWAGQVDGDFDVASRHALIAFQKVEGRQRTGKLNGDELQAMRAAHRPVPRNVGHAHIEIDLSRQVLFIVDASGSISRILPVCTGNEKTYVDHGQVHRAHTPRGKFKVSRKIAGWRRSSLGLLYYPNYIHAGIAIHGSLAMAAYPASHGCIRIPMFAAKEFSEMTPLGTEVVLYDYELAHH